jgi:hypothetical protein
MTCRQPCSLLLILSFALSPGAWAAEDWIQFRDGLQRGPTRFVPGGWINVIWLGGETHAGVGVSAPQNSYKAQLMKALRSQFPGAGMGDPVISGGAGSWWGTYAAARGQAVYGQHFPGAVLFLDLAADDEGQSEAEVTAALEGLVRSLWTGYPITDLVFLYGLRLEHLEVYRAGALPAVIQ